MFSNVFNIIFKLGSRKIYEMKDRFSSSPSLLGGANQLSNPLSPEKNNYIKTMRIELSRMIRRLGGNFADLCHNDNHFRILNERGERKLTAYLIHSLPCLMSAVQIFCGSVNIICHH